MRISICEIFVWTFLVGIIFTTSDLVLCFVTVASLGATFVVVPLFVASATSGLIKRRDTVGSHQYLLPFALWICICLAAMSSLAGMPQLSRGSPLQEFVSAAALSTFVAMVFASGPLMYALGRRYAVLSNRAVSIGFWSLVASMSGGLCLFLCIVNMESMLTEKTALDAYRIPAAGGLICSMLANSAVDSRSALSS